MNKKVKFVHPWEQPRTKARISRLHASSGNAATDLATKRATTWQEIRDAATAISRIYPFPTNPQLKAYGMWAHELDVKLIDYPVLGYVELLRPSARLRDRCAGQRPAGFHKCAWVWEAELIERPHLAVDFGLRAEAFSKLYLLNDHQRLWVILDEYVRIPYELSNERTSVLHYLAQRSKEYLLQVPSAKLSRTIRDTVCGQNSSQTRSGAN